MEILCKKQNPTKSSNLRNFSGSFSGDGKGFAVIDGDNRKSCGAVKVKRALVKIHGCSQFLNYIMDIPPPEPPLMPLLELLFELLLELLLLLPEGIFMLL